MSMDLPPVPPPPLPRPKLNKPVTIVAGCGLGILAVVVFVGIFTFVLSVYLPNKRLAQTRVFVDGVYAKAQSNKNLTKEQLAVYGEMVKVIDSPESSVFVVNIGGAVLFDHLKDGTVTEAEMAEAESLLDDLQKNKTGGMLAMASYIKAHPDMQVRIVNFATEMKYAPAGV